jgi:site-specific DNA-methyltransferase (adenine-specific)
MSDYDRPDAPLFDRDILNLAAEDLLSSLSRKSAAMVIIDPPEIMGVWESEDATPVVERTAALSGIAGEVARVLIPGGACLMLGAPVQTAAWEFAAEMAGLRFAAEFVILFDADKNADLGLSHHLSARWHVKPGFRLASREVISHSNVIVATEVPHERRRAATQRPIELFTYFISLLTEDNGLIVDPFCGTGSSLIAADICERRWVGGDIDEAMVDIASARVRDIEEQLNTKPLYLWSRGRQREV